MIRKLMLGIWAVAIAVLAVGCGGGGGGTSSGGASNSFVFLTNASNTNYDHLWTTITKVNLVSASGASTTVYDGTARGGKVIDLLSLRGSAGQQYLLLSGFKSSGQIYTGVNVTVASKLSVVAKGSSNVVAANFEGAKGTSMVLTAKFKSPQNTTKPKNVVIDFNTANWNLTGATMSASNSKFVDCGPGDDNIGSGNVIGSEYFGAVTNLAGTAPNLMFSLGQGEVIAMEAGPSAINIETNSSTVLTNADGSDNPTLVNGTFVSVTGAFDATTNRVVATGVTIQNGPPAPPKPEVFGLVTDANLASNTITVSLSVCSSFQPTSTTVTVNVQPTTTFIDLGGVTDTEEEFFKALVPGKSTVRVEGSFTDAVVTATSVQLVPPMVGGGDGSGSSGGSSGSPIIGVKGSVSKIDATAQTFVLTLSGWTGGWQDVNTDLTIATTPKTTYRDANGKTVDSAAFFAGLTNSSVVKVRGTLGDTPGVVTAEAIAILPPKGPGTVRRGSK